MVDMTRVSAQTNRSNLEHAFCAAEQLGVPRLLDPEGERGWFCLILVFFSFSDPLMAFASLHRCRRSVSRWKISHHVCFYAVRCLSKGTWRCWWNQSQCEWRLHSPLTLFNASLLKSFSTSTGHRYQVGGVPEHDQIPQPVDQTQCGHNVRQIIPQQPCWAEGIALFMCLWGLFCTTSRSMQQCCSAVAVFFLLVPFVLQALYSQYLQFKEYDIPLKENEKTKIKNLYKMLEVYTYTKAFCCLCCITQRGDIESAIVLFPTDVDRVWPYSVTPRTPSQWHREGVG